MKRVKGSPPSMSLSYDADNRLTTMVDGIGTTAYSYDQVGQLLSEGGLWLDDTVNYTYQNRLRMELSLAHPTGSSWTQEYVSRTVRPGPWIPGVSYGVNALNEITNATIGYSSQFVIPVTGSTTANASNVTVNGSSVTLYADNSFYASMIVTNGPNTFTAIARDTSGDLSTNTSTANVILTNSFYGYDLNGNLTNDGYKNFAYDDENELVAVWVTNTRSNSFAYDGKMRRRVERDYSWTAGTSQWTETNEIHFIYDGNLVVEERNASNVPLVSYTRGLDLSGTLQGAGGIGGLVARTPYGQELPGAPTSEFYHADGNGNITALMYPNQQLAAKYLYDPFGNMLAMSGPLGNFNKYRFSSKEWNDNSGLYYYGYRFYDAELKRWPNRDPLQEQGGVNLYAFVANNPLTGTDPLGLDTSGPPDGSNVSSQEHNSYLIFHITCPKGKQVANVKLDQNANNMFRQMYNWANPNTPYSYPAVFNAYVTSVNSGLTWWNGEQGFGGISNQGQSNCDGNPVEVDVAMRTRLVATGNYGIYWDWRHLFDTPDPATMIGIYEQNSRISYTCDCCPNSN